MKASLLLRVTACLALSGAGAMPVLVHAIVLGTTCAQSPASQQPALDGPLSAEKAAQSFRLEPGLRVELVAAEPLIESPVAIAFDERGRLFVAENQIGRASCRERVYVLVSEQTSRPSDTTSRNEFSS